MSRRSEFLRPETPAVVERWIERWGGESIRPEGTALLQAGLTALGQARRRPGRDRRAAEALLAADALLTYAVEDAAHASDPESALRLLVRAVSREVSL